MFCPHQQNWISVMVFRVRIGRYLENIGCPLESLCDLGLFKVSVCVNKGIMTELCNNIWNFNYGQMEVVLCDSAIQCYPWKLDKCIEKSKFRQLASLDLLIIGLKMGFPSISLQIFVLF